MLNNHVTIAISSDSVGVPRASFGTAAIVSHTAAWPERFRQYNDLAGVLADFPSTTSPEYVDASALLSSNPQIEKFLIVRASLAPTMRFELTPTAADLTEYKVTVEGDGVTPTTVAFTSDASATVAEICAGLEPLISAVVGNNYAVVDNTTSLTITADAPGEWFSIEVHNEALIKNEITHADPGIATDLAAIQLETSDWYCLLTPMASGPMVLAAAAWIETQKKIYIPNVPETEACTTAAGNADTLDTLASLNRARTRGVYHPSNARANAASWSGKCLPSDPGSITWKDKTPPGVPSIKAAANSTYRANLVARSANFCEASSSVTDTMSNGTTADGDYLDIARGIDWIHDDMQKRVFSLAASVGKIPLNDDGAATLEAAIRATLTVAVRMGIINDDFVITVPVIGNVSNADKAARLFAGIKFSATLQGAVHKVAITGSITL